MAKIYNGGKSFTVGGVTVNTLKSYSPRWVKNDETGGFEFSLSFTAYGLTQSEMTALKNAMTSDSVTISCDEYSGAVHFKDITPSLSVGSIYGTYYELSATAEQGAGGSSDPTVDKTFTLAGVSFGGTTTPIKSYGVSYGYGTDGTKFSMSFSAECGETEAAAIRTAIPYGQTPQTPITLTSTEYTGLVTCDITLNATAETGKYEVSGSANALSAAAAGISVTLGSIVFSNITSYSPSWAVESDNEGGFIDWQGNKVETILGTRYSLSFTSSGVPSSTISAIPAMMQTANLTLISLEYPNGISVVCNSVSPVRNKDTGLYDVSVSVTAAALEAGAGGSL